MEEFTKLTDEQAEIFLRNDDSVNWNLRKMICARFPGMRVLDIGCGNGNDSTKFSVENYVGIDISEPLIKAAKKFNPLYNYQIMDATKLDFNDKSFDGAFAVGVMEHFHSFEDTRKCLKEMIRVSSKKICIGWHSPPHDNGPTIIKQVQTGPLHFNMIGYSNRYNKQELVDGIINSSKIRFIKKGFGAIWEISI
jgi:ubiquinone/menaquinone biosynthesis C-methylase UbiE